MTSFGYVIPCPFTLLHLLPTFLSACYCRNESEIDFLAVTSSWGYQHGFSAQTSQFLSNATPLL